MTVLKLVVLKNEVLKSGRYKIKVSVFHNKQTCYISTDFSVASPSHLKYGVVTKEPDCSVINSKLRALLNKYQGRLDEIQYTDSYDCKQIKQMILHGTSSNEPVTIKTESDEFVAFLRSNRRYSYASLIEMSIRYFCEFTNGDMFIKDITPSLIEAFAKNLRERKKKYSDELFSPTMVGMVLTRVKVIINRAIKERKVSFNVHPFISTTIGKSRTRNIDVSVDTIKAIREYEPSNRRLLMARDIFMLSFYMAGMNLIDMMNIDFRNSEAEYERTKTKNRFAESSQFYIYISDEAKSVAEKWLNKNGHLDFGYELSYRNFNTYVSKSIAKMKDELNISDKLLFYSARKTFSQFAADLGISESIINYCLGHSDSSRGVMQYYTKIKKGQARNAIEKVIDYLENFADSVRWQLQKVSAEKEKISAGTLRLLGGVSLWQ